MPLYRPRYLVEYDPTQPPLEVTVTTGDMMRGELEATKLKLPEKAPFHATALWLWSALVRAGIETRKAVEFIADPPEWEPVRKPGTDEPDSAELDPTEPGSGQTDSGAPASTALPSSG